MRRISAFILVAGTLITLTACHSSDDETPQPSLAGQPMFFSAVTEQEEIGVLAQGDVVGMTVINELTGEATTVNAAFTVDANGMLQGVEDILFPATGPAVSLFAYSPYRADWNVLTDSYLTVDVPVNQSLYEQYHAADFIIGLPEGGNPVSRTDVKMVFTHAFAQVNLELTDPTESVGLSTADVRIGPVITSAFVNPRTGEVAPISTETGVIFPYATLMSHHTEASQTAGRGASTRSDRRETYSCIVIPQDRVMGSAFLEVATASRTYKFALPAFTQWRGSMSYDYQVEITADGISLVSTSINRWTEYTGDDLYLEEDD